MNRDLHEDVFCGLCGADNPKLLFGTHQLPGGKIGGVVRCRTCGLVYRNVRQNAASIRRYFEQGEDADLSPDWIAGRKKAFAEHLILLESFRRNNRILDVGAGHGYFLSTCADRGWNCYGVETSRRAVDYAQRNFGLSLYCGAFEEAVYPDEYFDAVTFFNVLEFLPDPKSALQKTHQLLRPGGVVTVRFSNAVFHVAAYRFFLFLGRIHRRLNHGDQAVIHLYAFDKNSITRLLLESGFEEIKMSWTPLSWTTTSHERIGSWRKLACKLLDACACFFHLVSFKSLLISPSLTAIARKG
ncbi:MAG: class I SAM-dependent methyltransferase [Kiritimatiellae bacterium]|nr:class I SAM-dependent methyltransferase [Verrucomicrobiota bacterium]MCG2661797.1 class I SAM-dependent methyltransferase [Kiritimatiellia bacterium]